MSWLGPVEWTEPLYLAFLVEMPEGRYWIICLNDPVNNTDPLGLAGYFFGGTGNSLEPGGISNVEILYGAWDVFANGSRWYVPGVFSGLQPGGEKNGVLDTMGHAA